MTKKLRKFKLSESRQKYTENREGVLVGEPLRPNERLMQRQADEVVKMVERMSKDISKELMSLFSSDLAKESVAQDASISSQAIILLNRLSNQWVKRFNKFAKLFSDDMVAKQNKYVSKDMRNSLEKLSGGLSIDTSTMSQTTRNIIRAKAEETTSLIKSIAPEYLSQVKEGVMRSIVSDSSSVADLQSSIQSVLTGRFKKYRNKAKNLAVEQTRSVYNELSTQRLKETTNGDYVWVHTGGSQDPREYHRDVLNGQTFNVNDPPVIDPKTGKKGNPGDDYFCRCIKKPIIKFGGN